MDLPETGSASLILYDCLGRKVRTLRSGSAAGGGRSVSFTAGDLPAGVYLLVLKTDRSVRTRKIVRIE
jgi:hypothetical protein